MQPLIPRPCTTASRPPPGMLAAGTGSPAQVFVPVGAPAGAPGPAAGDARPRLPAAAGAAAREDDVRLLLRSAGATTWIRLRGVRARGGW